MWEDSVAQPIVYSMRLVQNLGKFRKGISHVTLYCLGRSSRTGLYLIPKGICKIRVVYKLQVSSKFFRGVEFRDVSNYIKIFSCPLPNMKGTYVHLANDTSFADCAEE